MSPNLLSEHNLFYINFVQWLINVRFLFILHSTEYFGYVQKKGISSLELSCEFEQRQMACRRFKWKVQLAMAQSEKLCL